MENMDINVQKIGLSRCLNNNIKYYSQLNTRKFIKLKDSLPDIKHITSVIIDCEIVSLRGINTIKGLSVEGHYLYGKKILAEIKLKQKILYTADNTDKSVHMLEKEFYHMSYIVIPPFIEGTEIDYLIRHNRFKTRIYVEDIIIKVANKRNISETIFILIEGYYVPTYELCYSIYHNDNSNIFISFEDGTNTYSITSNETVKNINPSWSPNGKELAFISNFEDSYMLYIYNYKNGLNKRVTDPSVFKRIRGYYWMTDSNNIIFSATKDYGIDIYILDIRKLTFKQLTYGNGLIDSIMPKCSNIGKKFAYLSSCSGINNIVTMNINGLDNKQVTECGHIKDYNWFNNKESIVYIRNNDAKVDELFQVDIRTLEKVLIELPKNIVNIKKVKVSPNDNFISFIGSDLITDDIYIYDIKNNKTINLTNNYRNVKTTDFVWKIDGTKIYYSANNFGYYNIYHLSLKDKNRCQITNNNATKIQLSYRPKNI